MVKGNGVHTAFIDHVELLNSKDDIEIVINNNGRGDVFHCHTYGPYYFLKGLRYKNRRVHTVHVIPDSIIGSLPMWPLFMPFVKWYFRQVYSYADVCIAISPRVEEAIKETGAKTEIVRIFNPINIAKWKRTPENRKKGRELLGLTDDEFVVLGVGQLQARKGVEDFIDKKLPVLRRFGVPVIVSIAGEREEELVELAKRLKSADALEVNLSCPNVKHGSRESLIAQDADATYACIAAVRKSTRLTVIAKLTPNVSDITMIARAAESAGADAVLVANTILGMAVDIDTKKAKLGNICGGLSGPAIKPIVLKMVWDTFRKVKIPVIGCGGIMDYRDAVEFLLCGAAAIQVGTANFVDPNAAGDIVKGIEKYMVKNKIEGIDKLRGGLLV